MKPSLISTVVLLLLVSQLRLATPVAARPAASDELRVKLAAPVRGYELSANNFIEALTRVAGEFKIPLGVAWVNTSVARTNLTLSWKDSTVGEVIEAIARTQPGYEVYVRSGVVHVSSPKLMPDQQNFLKLKIRTFEVHDEGAASVSRRLHDLARAYVSPPTPQLEFGGRIGMGGSGASNTDDPRISLRLDSVTLEDALDKLALASNRKIWIVTFSEDITALRGGFRRTLTLWNNFPIPDNEQPLWDLFHWGEEIPTAVLEKK